MIEYYCYCNSDYEEDEECDECKQLLNINPKKYDPLPEEDSDEVERKIAQFENEYFEEYAFLNSTESSLCPELSIPITADVRKFDFPKLAQKQLKLTSQLFDVIMMDPPWQLSTSQPTRGVAIAYDSLPDNAIMEIPVPTLQKDGLLFIWVINAKYRFAIDLMDAWGYTLVDEICWVKQTVTGKLAKGHGFYLQHAKETCLVGVKGDVEGKLGDNISQDVIFSLRKGQSQKPTEIYQIIEKLVPNGYYLEIFGRRNNLRSGWVTVGNEL
eukprot:CAMPEP_0115043924 /NCGR_PEP_ID=MMETSP0216-20121206/47164_1 /TAXON_ID=223996 /ORGANISM="Protocruzia adherens, Strain Boccale" /LENGTH=268 /DNA_ID=CAMNT_0002426349 /DNA_START=64 /DNA_END=869 /DNA_ORIENTATION=-